MNVLVILLGALGDVVRGFSVLPPLRQALPDVSITWLVEPKCRGIVDLHPMIDEVLVFERDRGLRGIPSLLRELRRRSFDITLDLQRHSKSGIFSLCSGAPRRVGFNRRNAKEFNWLFNNLHIDEVSNSVSKVLHYQKFLEPLGISIPPEVDFGIRDLDWDQHLPEELRDVQHPLIGIVMGSSWVSKNWPLEGYSHLVRSLLHEGYHLVLLGDRTQAEASARLAERCADPRLTDLVGKTRLEALVATVKRASVCVGPDSGPGHIAAAVGTPYIGMFGPTTPDRVAPFGSEHLAIRTTVGCHGCFRRVCPGLNTVCMRLISPGEVVGRTREVLAKVYS